MKILHSDSQILGLISRNNWEVADEKGEELNIYIFKGASKKEKSRAKIIENRNP